jgi:energy-coupling factor transport system ATP-binding protein
MTQFAGAGPDISLEFRDWGYRHPSRSDFAVRGLDLTIRRGERVLLLGASGVGKSTILSAAAGLLGSQDETDVVGNVDEDDENDEEGGSCEGSLLVNAEAVLMLQDPESQMILARLGDNVAFGLENMGSPTDGIWSKVSQSLDSVGLRDVEVYRSTSHLSGGQQQRAALAGALAMGPNLLLLDEPTANLDPAGAAQVVQSVASVMEEAGTASTLVVVEHRPDRWLDIVNRVVVLASVDGITRVVADGRPSEVFNGSDFNGSDSSGSVIDFDALGVWVPAKASAHEIGCARILHTKIPHTNVEPAPVLLEAQNVAIGRDNHPIATGIDLEFRAGRTYAIVGLNGAGKSTLALTLSGLLKPLDGQVVAGDELRGECASAEPAQWKSSELVSRISYVFQNPEHQFVRSTVLGEVELALAKGTKETAEIDAGALLAQFGLEQYAQVNPYTLSGGQKRRLTVVTALAAQPQVIILDEPTYGQDKTTWKQMIDVMGELVRRGICIIVVTHDKALVEALDAEEILMGEDGIENTVEDIAENVAENGRAIRVTPVVERKELPKLSSRSPVIARINPAFRLIAALLLGVPLLFSLDAVSAGVAFALEIILFAIIRISPWRLVCSTWPVFVGAPFSGLAVLLYGREGGRVLAALGMIHITELSANLALATFLRVLAIGVPAVVLVLGIDPTDLADAFSQVLRLPDRFVYGGLAGMRLFSVIRDDWSALTKSRRTRGLGEANKFLNFFPQVFALLVLSIRRSTQLAVAMQARGFDRSDGSGNSIRRSHARVSAIHARDWVFLVCALAVPAAALLVAGCVESV